MPIFLGDYGIKITLECGKNISAASTLSIKYRKPKGDTGTWTGTLEGTTALYYTTVDGDIDELGEWLIQAYVVLSGQKFHGDIVSLDVKSPLF